MVGEPTYPQSEEEVVQTPILASEQAKWYADFLYMGGIPADDVALGAMLRTYTKDVILEHLATDKIRIPFTNINPPTLMVNGHMLKAAADVDLASSITGGASTRYIFAVRTAAATTFTLRESTSSAEGTDERIIGELEFDGSDIDKSTIISYEAQSYGEQARHPSIVKAWVVFSPAGTITDSHNITSVNKTTTGKYTVTIADDMASANYAISAVVTETGTSDGLATIVSRAAGSFAVWTYSMPTAGFASLEDHGCGVIIIGDLN